MFRMMMISTLRWSEVTTMMIKCANVPFRVAQSMNTRVPLSITFPCNSHDYYKIQIQKKLDQQHQCIATVLKVNKHKCINGLLSQKRVGWSGYPFDCYDDCGAKMHFFNSIWKNGNFAFGQMWKVGDMCLFNNIAMTNSKTNLNTYKEVTVHLTNTKEGGELDKYS